MPVLNGGHGLEPFWPAQRMPNPMKVFKRGAIYNELLLEHCIIEYKLV
jgi:hypothetical protein